MSDEHKDDRGGGADRNAGSAKSGDAGADASKNKPAKPPMSRRGRFLIIGAVVLVVLAALIAGLLWWLHARHFENTDDAYIDTNIIHVAPQESGQVTRVLVADNQAVRAGDLLVDIDSSVARNQLAQARAAEAQARSQIAQAQAQVVVSGAQVRQARANTKGPAAQADNAALDYRRYLSVQSVTPAAVAGEQVDQARTNAIVQAGQLEVARRQVQTNEAQETGARTQLGAGRAQLETARAQIAQANLQLGYGRVVAPVDGYVSHKTVAIGNYVQPGQEMLSLVPNEVWVTANFKETQLDRIRVGQRVALKIDAYPHVNFEGHVNSIQHGAGQSFALLPAQNATGNFVKVVQRVPVKIVIDRPRDRQYVLGPGMSVKPSVRVD